MDRSYYDVNVAMLSSHLTGGRMATSRCDRYHSIL